MDCHSRRQPLYQQGCRRVLLRLIRTPAELRETTVCRPQRPRCVSETEYLKDLGFNGVGAWSNTEIITSLPGKQRIPYCVMFYVSNRYKSVLKKLGTEDEAFRRASWEGYPNDMVMVFDEGLEEMADKVLKEAEKYADDPYCLGYFVDNELPWRNTNLEFCLTRWPEDHRNHIAARKWLDERKGVSDFPVEQVTEEDRQAFTAYCFARYQSMIRETLRKYDSNHMYLGCRMSNWHYELSNDLLFREAGKYQDIISLNHSVTGSLTPPDSTTGLKWPERPVSCPNFTSRAKTPTDTIPTAILVSPTGPGPAG